MGRADHLPTERDMRDWPRFTATEPLRLLVSACLLGVPCGVDGTSYGAPFGHIDRLLDLPNVHVVRCCPEHAVFGTPRATPDIHGGDGNDVLDGTARVRSSEGDDWTAPMIDAAYAMLALAREHRVHLALLTDISAACGSQIVYRGARTDGRHQPGQGVCAALLVRNGCKVVSQRDHRTLGRLIHTLDPTFVPDMTARDHHETEWYVTNFG